MDTNNSSNSPIVETKNLSVGYSKSKTIIEDINISVFAGSITSVVGQNGCGKSTLLKTIARQLKPHAGDVNISNKNIWELSSENFSKKCSYLPQFLPYDINLTVKELVSLGRNPHQNWWSWNASQVDIDAIESAMAKANVEVLKNRYLSTLSGGEKQRALIAQALAQNSEVILLDEPISSLDFKHQLSVIQLLKDLKNSGMAIVVVLHDLNIIDHISDWVVLVGTKDNCANQIVHQGKPKKVLSRKTIKEFFDVHVDIVPSTSKGVSRRLFNLFG